MTENTKLMLIDGHSLVHRAFNALPEDLTTSTGEPTNAVLGFANIVLKEISELKPSHIIMAMDRPAPTFRHEASAAYKATRPRMPSLLAGQFPRVREVASALNIPIHELDGFEADDILGTLSLQAEEQHISTVIVTGDLDALQLVSRDVAVSRPGRNIIDTKLYDEEAVRDRFGLEPDQLPDWKALVGDTSDNIQGVTGIGAKTASELLAKYGNLEGIFAHLHELSPKRRDLLEPNRDQAFASRHLATIVRTAPVTLDLTHAAHVDIDRTRVIDLFRQLEFRQLIERMHILLPIHGMVTPSAPTPDGGPLRQLGMFADLQDEGSGRSASTPEGVLSTTTVLPVLVDTRIVRTETDLSELLTELRGAGKFAVDTETTSTDPLRARLVGLSFATNALAAWYIPIGHADGEQLPMSGVLNALRPLLEDRKFTKIGHNLKYDYAVLLRHGIDMRELDFDTMIAAFLVKPRGRGLSLSALALARFGVEMTPIESLIGKGKNQITMDLVAIETVATYAGADASLTLQLMEQLAPEVLDQGVEKLFREVEMPLVPVLADMEMTGVRLNTSVLTQMSTEITEIISRLVDSIYQRAGRPFNINSTGQLGQVLFEEFKLPSGRRTKTGRSTDSEVLEGLRGKHPIVDEILEYRQLVKLKNTYIDSLPSLLNPDTSRLHTDFNQAGAATGRLSSSGPNLQNIPIRGEVGRKIRRAFIPSTPGNVLLAADYSQIELRILASMSGDERLVDAFQTGEDIHRATAAAVFNVPLAEVTPDQRRVAKVVNFGIVYGIGEQRLAFETGISRQEAAQFISTYNQTYAGVKSYMDGLRKHAALYEYVETHLHRRRYTPEIHSDHPGVRAAAERAAINMPIQGTAADIIKLAMVRVHAHLAAEYPAAKMVLQVHDELVFDVPSSDVSGVAQVVRQDMENAVPLNVPIEVELKVGSDWYDMEPIEKVTE